MPGRLISGGLRRVGSMILPDREWGDDYLTPDDKASEEAAAPDKDNPRH